MSVDDSLEILEPLHEWETPFPMIFLTWLPFHETCVLFFIPLPLFSGRPHFLPNVLSDRKWPLVVDFFWAKWNSRRIKNWRSRRSSIRPHAYYSCSQGILVAGPDRLLLNFTDSELFSFCSRMSSDGFWTFKIVKGSVGEQASEKKPVKRGYLPAKCLKGYFYVGVYTYLPSLPLS